MPDGKPQLCLSDFIAPKKSGQIDYIGAFAVTTGHGIDDHVKAFEDAHDDYQAILLKALADRFAESFAEHLHRRIRKEFWGYANNESLSNEELIREKYRGIRRATPRVPTIARNALCGHCSMLNQRPVSLSPIASPCGPHPQSAASILLTQTQGISLWVRSERINFRPTPTSETSPLTRVLGGSRLFWGDRKS